MIASLNVGFTIHTRKSCLFLGTISLGHPHPCNIDDDVFSLLFRHQSNFHRVCIASHYMWRAYCSLSTKRTNGDFSSSIWVSIGKKWWSWKVLLPYAPKPLLGHLRHETCGWSLGILVSCWADANMERMVKQHGLEISRLGACDETQCNQPTWNQ